MAPDWIESEMGGITDLLPGLPPGFQRMAVASRDYADAQFLAVIAAVLDVRDSVDALDTRDETVWRRDDAVADGAGAATVTLDGPRAGFSWRIERLSTVVVGGAGTIGALYLGQISPGMLAYAITDADFTTVDFGAAIWVPSTVPVVIALTGAPANAPVSVAVQAVETVAPE